MSGFQWKRCLPTVTPTVARRFLPLPNSSTMPHLQKSRNRPAHDRNAPDKNPDRDADSSFPFHFPGFLLAGIPVRLWYVRGLYLDWNTGLLGVGLDHSGQVDWTSGLDWNTGTPMPVRTPNSTGIPELNVTPSEYFVFLANFFVFLWSRGSAWVCLVWDSCSARREMGYASLLVLCAICAQLVPLGVPLGNIAYWGCFCR